MKKMLTLALLFTSTLLLACPMQGGNCGQGCQGIVEKCDCDTSKLPPRFEKLGLSDAQKEQVKQIRDETKAFRNQQHEKMMAVFTPEQRKMLDSIPPKMCPKGNMQMPQGGMGCKNCKK